MSPLLRSARPALLTLAATLLLACGGSSASAGEATQPKSSAMKGGVAPSATEGEHGVALLAGGCFWCLEAAYEGVDGVVSAVSGYAGGEEQNPTYKQVSYHQTGHLEVVRVVYEKDKLTYRQVLDRFWHNIDPFDDRGQFCDKGDQYKAAIFPLDADQKKEAEASKVAVEKELGRPVVTTIEPAAVFWEAEAYHQDFHETNPVRYGSYRLGCGRDKRLKDVWGDDAGH